MASGRRANKLSPYTIVVDTRDKPECRWTFSEYIEKDGNFDVAIKKIDVGDYCIDELPEKTLCIERKKSFVELANNISNNDKERFKRELNKMSKYKYAYIITEFTLDELLRGSRYTTIPPAYLLSVMLEIQAKYGIHVFFAGKNAEMIAYKIMRKIWMLENQKERWN